MRKGIFLSFFLVFLVACSNEQDIENYHQGKLNSLNSSLSEAQTVTVHFNSSKFYEKELHQLNSWKNNLIFDNDKISYKIFNIDGILKVLIYIDGKFAFTTLDELPMAYNDFHHDTFIFDDVSQNFRLLSSSLEANSLSIISLSR